MMMMMMVMCGLYSTKHNGIAPIKTMKHILLVVNKRVYKELRSSSQMTFWQFCQRNKI